MEYKAIHWIEAAEAGGQEEWTWFRYEFELPADVEMVVVRFVSTGVCGLFVNGEFVEAATSRYSGRVYAFAITRRLRPGRNIIGLQSGSNYLWPVALEQRQSAEGWISLVAVEIEIISHGGGIERIVGDNKWQASRTRVKNWADEAVESPSFAPVCIRHPVDLAEYERSWQRAVVWEEVSVPYRAGHINPVRIECETNACILDFGRTTVGYLDLTFASPPQSPLTATFEWNETTEELKKGAINRHRVVDDMQLPIAMPPGETQWLNLRRRAGRYMRIETTDGSTMPKLTHASIRQSALPVQARGDFSCSNDTLNRIWDVARYTLWVNMHQEYESCPRHEMLFFTGDGRPDLLSDWYAFGDGRLMDASLALTGPAMGDFRNYYGLFKPGSGPNQVLWDYGAWRVISVADHYRLTGDVGMVRRNWDDCCAAATWMWERTDESGLIEQCHIGTGRYSIVEWTCSDSRIGRKAFLNCLLAKTLADMADMAEVLGQEEEAKSYQIRAENVSGAINERLWSDASGGYIDERYDYLPQDGNALAIIFGIAPVERARRALDSLKNRNWSPYGSTLADRQVKFIRGGNTVISPLMCGYEAEARFLTGGDDEALDLIERCWGTMLQKGASTFWEYAPNDAHGRWPLPCHAWSSGPAYILPAYVLGVRPTKPGFLQFVVHPRLCNLTWAKGVIPTPYGLIRVSWEIKDSPSRHWTCAVDVPEGTSATLIVPNRFASGQKDPVDLAAGHHDLDFSS